MTKRIDQFVSENRDNVKRIDATFVPTSGQSNKNLTFGNNEIEVSTAIQIYTRPLNNTLISGHPNGNEHGSGEGESGDTRGSWTLVEDVEASESFVTSGRNALRNALAAQAGSHIGKIALGTGTSDAGPSDSALDTETARVFAWPKPGGSNNQSVAESIFLFHEHSDSNSEYAAYSAGGDIYNRITTTAVNTTEEEECRVEIEFTVTSNTLGSAVITNTGENRIAGSLRAIDTPIGLNGIVFGSGSTAPSKTDTSLATREFAKRSQVERSSETVTTRTIVFQNEPTEQPVNISEIGVEDNSGNLLWRTVIEQFEKKANMEFDAYVGFRVK